MNCEMCGRKVLETKNIDVEGTILAVCPGCVRYGKLITSKKEEIPKIRDPILDRLEIREKRNRPGDIYSKITTEFVADYDMRVRKRREDLNLTKEELARKLNEKKSTITKIESKHLHPDNKLIKKLEKLLQIKLTEEIPSEVEHKKSGLKKVFTIGDLIEIKKG